MCVAVVCVVYVRVCVLWCGVCAGGSLVSVRVVLRLSWVVYMRV